MRASCLFLLIAVATSAAFSQEPKTIKAPKIVGKLLRHENFGSKHVDKRNVDVWLPPDYDKGMTKYPVIYMHDGQMLFDADSTWNKQEWGIDETMTRLIGEGKIEPAIVVGIWNTPERRHEYMPQKAFEMASPEQKKAAAAFGITNVISDRYLKFLVNELKPFIDETYRTKPYRRHTFTMGSSMGGLISLYALSEYPGTFGSAACISTHFPAGDGAMIDYMKKYLPYAKISRIYFDYGTATLDALYEPYQLRADEVMRQKGYRMDKNWVTRKFPGDDHSETSWRNRAEIPLTFLLGKQK